MQDLLEGFMYSCGYSLVDLNLPPEYNNVEITDHDCYDVIEKLYYSAKNEPICVYCAKDQPYTSDNLLPICVSCEAEGKPPITK